MGYIKPKATVLEEAIGKTKSEDSHSPRLLTVAEACSILRISRQLLYQLIRGNELKSLKVRKRRLFREPDLHTFIEQHLIEAET